MRGGYLFIFLISLAGIAFRSAPFPSAIDITGTWKRTAMPMVEAGGKKTDPNATLNKSMPCLKDVTYTFLSDGQMKSNVPDACGALKKTIEDMNTKSKWTATGGRIVVTTTMKDILPSTYDISVQGNTKAWLFT
jgi:hypothetical protein